MEEYEQILKNIREKVDVIKADTSYGTWGSSVRVNRSPSLNNEKEADYVRTRFSVRIKEVDEFEKAFDSIVRDFLKHDIKFSFVIPSGNGGINPLSFSVYAESDWDINKFSKETQEVIKKYSFPYVQDVQEELEKKKKEEAVYDVIKKYISKPTELEQFGNTVFIQEEGVERKVPFQGWKMHISAKDLEDYKELLEVVLPEFQNSNINYKIVDPQMFEQFKDGKEQAGKLITVYLDDNFKWDVLSERCKEKLLEESTVVKGDKQIDGRMSMRYGRFRAGYSMDSKTMVLSNGEKVTDPRNKSHAPLGIKDRSFKEVLDLIKSINERHVTSGDHKTFLQESMLMDEFDGLHHMYTTVILPDEKSKELAEKVIKERKESLSFIKHTNNESVSYLLLHNDSESIRSDIIRAFSSNGCELKRPSWDYKYNCLVIQEPDLKKMTMGMHDLWCDKQYKTEISNIQFEFLRTGDGVVFMYETNRQNYIESVLEESEIDYKMLEANLSQKEYDAIVRDAEVIKMDASKMMIESERYNYPEDPDWDDELEEEEIDGYEF